MTKRKLFGVLVCLCAAACEAPSATRGSAVDFSTAPQLGTSSGQAGVMGSVPLAGTGVLPQAGAGSDTGAAGVGSAGVGAAGSDGLAGSGAAGTASAAGTGGAAGVSGAAGTDGAAGTGVSALTSMKFTVTTLPQNGRYNPKNIGAIWVANSSGQFVKTLEVWAFIRAQYLSKFNGASGGNRVDAVTSATLGSHKTHSVTWNLKDASGNASPPGDYQVMVEVTDHDGAGKTVAANFTLGDSPMTITPPNDTYFSGMSIELK